MGAQLNPDLCVSVLVPAVYQEVNLELFLQRFGTGRRRRAMESIYSDMLEEARELLEPLSLYRTFPAYEVPQYGDFIAGAEWVTLGICSVGREIDRRVEDLAKVKMANAVVLDEIGTVMVLELANQMYKQIRAAAKTAQQRTSPSYRPGIGRWPLELQNDIYEDLSAEAYGLQLHESLQILPQKTVSMIVGSGSELRIRRVPVQWYRMWQN
ncbi:MAG: hypothetical protein JXA25_14115 [Anaerolineales bacterium]|nr:hypothetical protein [Anaerolineales bacterium]